MLFGREISMWMGLVNAAIALAVGFGLQLSNERQALLTAFVSVFLAFIVRQNVTPVTKLTDNGIDPKKLVSMLLPFLLVAGLASTPACAGKNAPTLIGQTSVALAQSIGQLQLTTKQLTDAGTIPPTIARDVQRQLLVANGGIQKAIPILEALDHAIQAGQGADPVLVDQVVAVLQSVSTDLSTVVAGVPLAETTKTFITLVRAAQSAVTTVLVEVARFKKTPVVVAAAA